MPHAKIIAATTIMVVAAWAGVEASKASVILPGGESKVLLRKEIHCTS
jgi:hypothetical protein